MDKHREYRQALKTYQLGFFLALVLTAIPTALVLWVNLPARWMLGSLFVLGLLQIIVHFRYFLHIGLGRNSRHRLNLLLFSALIIVLMVAGSLLVFFDQMGRMS